MKYFLSSDCLLIGVQVFYVLWLSWLFVNTLDLFVVRIKINGKASECKLWWLNMLSQAYPEKFYYEGIQQDLSSPIQHQHLPVYFGNVCLRFIPVSIAFIMYVCVRERVFICQESFVHMHILTY